MVSRFILNICVFTFCFALTAWSQEPFVNEIQDEIISPVEQLEQEVIDQVKSASKPIPMSEEILNLDDIAAGGSHSNLQESKVIPLLHAEASTIIEKLNQMRSVTGEITYNEDDRTLILKDFPKELDAMTNYVKEVDILLETEVFMLAQADAKDILKVIEQILTQNVGQAKVNEKANSIVVTDTPLKIGAVRELISKHDQISREIHFSTKVLQIVLNDEHDQGVDWEAIVSDYQSLIFQDQKESSKEQALKIGTISAEDYVILLEALDTVGLMSSVSGESIKSDHLQTTIVKLESLDFPDLEKLQTSTDDLSNIDNGQVPQARKTKVHMQLYLTPSISRNAPLMVTISPQRMAKDFNITDLENRIKSDVEIEDGSTIVIGSYFDKVTVKSNWKIPLLGDIPVLGFVFRNSGEVLRKAEIITFVTVKLKDKNKF